MDLDNWFGDQLTIWREDRRYGRSNYKMNRIRRSSPVTGFTLIELLCVITIIMVLAALVAGVGSRVLHRLRADQWAEQAEVQLGNIVKKLHMRYEGQRTFPLVTLADLESHGMFNRAEVRFFEDPRVTFTSFAATDDDEKVVIRVQIEKGFWGAAGFRTATKGEITKLRL